MKANNEKERTVWSSNDGKFENVFNPTPLYDVDSIPKKLTKSRSHESFVVEWQMTTEGEIPDTKSASQSHLYF